MQLTFVFTLFLALLGSLIMEASACICPAVYTPVCGTNGVTYSNECQMKCAGAKMKRRGKC